MESEARNTNTRRKRMVQWGTTQSAQPEKTDKNKNGSSNLVTSKLFSLVKCFACCSWLHMQCPATEELHFVRSPLKLVKSFVKPRFPARVFRHGNGQVCYPPTFNHGASPADGSSEPRFSGKRKSFGRAGQVRSRFVYRSRDVFLNFKRKTRVGAF